MLKNFLALILAGLMMLSLCACQNEVPPESGDFPPESTSQAENQSETKTETEDFGDQAVALTEMICETQINAKNDFAFNAENANYRGFIIMLAAYEYPYKGVFPKDENAIYHFPEDEIARAVYEVFGIENYKWEYGDGKGEGITGFDYDAEKGEFTSGLEFGIGGGLSVKEPSVSSNGSKVTVDFVLTDNEGFAGEPGWTEYGDFRTIFTVMEGEDGKFLRFESLECIGLFEPLLIAEHIAALNEVFAETFFTDFDQNGESYVRLFNEEQQGTPANAVPDAMARWEDLYDSDGSFSYATEMYNGYYIDMSFSDCYLIENFTNKEEIRGTLRQWLGDEIFDGDNLAGIDENLIEFDGRVFMVRGGRGYGVASCSGFEITEQTETEIKATGTYFTHGDPAGTIDLVFSVDGNTIILESYTINRAE